MIEVVYFGKPFHLRFSSFRPSSSSSSVAMASGDDDNLSVMSDDSDTSESYVVINPNDGANGRESIDATLFAINVSSRASPVEIGLEVTEETSPSESLRSNVDRVLDPASVKRDVGGMKKDGNVIDIFCLEFSFLYMPLFRPVNVPITTHWHVKV